ncbi:radial spoke head protein 9 homolog [Astyanax mexicanus]|uniref:Radial spoke head protein 9 homolog n=1 Tax=Astyanax mexicanus TaxID=7994 RepID=A0A8B9KTJ4_ASTMX|nr:radial spoke head protein 9 homolog [Astyanax mexicanus]KAG9275454.1 hypothetical protein AMEX_G9972 [Astyanax mexicanus]
MDLEALYTSLDLLSRFGVTLNAEHRAALQTSFIILKTHMKFSRVLFWGKIFGLERDYYIAQGLGEDEIKDRKYFYSQDCIDWYLLPPATETLIDEVAVAAKGRFMGDPSHKYEQGTMEKEEGGGFKVVKVSEEQRLAVTVFTIDQEAVVPKGAYIKKTFSDCVCTMQSLLWQGLTTFFELPITKLQGYIYMGDGLPTFDLSFM